MPQSIRRFDWGWVVVLGFATFSAWPFLTRPGLPTMTDAEMHVYRAAEVQYAIADGTLYPRWASDFYYGYGYPVFNYYSPLTYHVAAWYARLSGTDAVAGTKLVLVLAAYLGAAGMYLFARRRWSPGVGVVASAAWTLAPYVMFIDPHARGDAPETFALSIAPVLLWLFDCVRASGSRRTMAAAAVALAALILSHPLMSLAIYGFLLLFLIWESLIAPLVPRPDADDADPRRNLPALLGALILGLLLAAFYWLPAGLERSAIQLDNVAGEGFFDFRNNFIDLPELVQPAPLIDIGATEPDFRFSLGIAQAVLASFGFLTIFVNRLRRLDTMFFAFAGVGFMYLMTKASQGFWEAIPVMRFFQFPSRFLGPAALAVAPLAGVSVTWIRMLSGRARSQAVATALAVAALGAAAMPLGFPKPWSDFGDVSPLRMLEVELSGRARGTTSADDFLPVGVTVIPSAEPALLASYENDWPAVEKFNRATLPEGATAMLLETRAQSDRILVNTPERFVFRMYRFYYPGWEATVDGEPVEIEVAQPDGFITFWVPAGKHEIEVRLGSTFARRLGTWVSIAGLVAIVGVVGYASRRGAAASESARDGGPVLGLAESGLVLAVVLALLAVRGIGERDEWFTMHSLGDTVLVADNEIYAGLQSEVALLGYDVGSTVLRPGGQIPVTLYWKAIEPPTDNYRVFVHLIGPDGGLYGQSDKLNPAGFPTSRWPLDEYVRDEHELLITDTLPPGEYRLSVGLWNATTGQRLLAYDRSGEMLGDNVELPMLLQTR